MRSLRCAVAVLLTIATNTYADDPKRTPHVVVERIGSLDDAGNTFPVAINNRGQVVGSASDAAGRQVAFLWTRRDGFRVIAENAFPTDINNRGDVVGIWIRCSPTPHGQRCDSFGFIWSEPDGFRDLGTFTPSTINERGDMTSGGVMMRDGVITTNPLSERMSLRGINNRGDAVGFLQPPEEEDDAPLTAVLWRADGTVVSLGPGIASDISNSGAVAGVRSEEGISIGNVWTKKGVFTAPVSEGSVLDAINSRGDTVGRGSVGAFIWNFKTGLFVALEASTGFLDVNDRGVIVSWSNGPTGTEMFLWRVR